MVSKDHLPPVQLCTYKISYNRENKVKHFTKGYREKYIAYRVLGPFILVTCFGCIILLKLNNLDPSSSRSKYMVKSIAT